MGKSTRLTLEEIRDIMRLVSDVRELRHTPVVQQQVLLDGMVQLLGGERAFSVTYKHFQRGAMPQLVRVYLQPRIDPTFRSYLEQAAGDVTPWDDPMVHAVCDNPAQTGVCTLDRCRAQTSPRQFRVFDDYQSQYKIADRMSCTFRRPDGQAGITGLEIQRMDRAGPFEPRAIAMARLLIDELHHLYTKGQLEAPAHPFDTLPPRQREAARRILAGQSVKTIALEMNLSVHTVREYVQAIYRKLGVSGREELMARFIRA